MELGMANRNMHSKSRLLSGVPLIPNFPET